MQSTETKIQHPFKTSPQYESLRIEDKPVSELKPHPDNPRIHSKKQIRQIAESIKTFGFRFPVLIDQNNRVIAGHGRVLACEYIGISIVPTLLVDDLSDEKIRALMIADNKLTENAKWDEKLLAQNFKILMETDLDFDIDVSGFDYGHIEGLVMSIEDTDMEDEEEFIDKDLLDDNNILVSQSGDVWELGEHRLLCADALKPESYELLMNDKNASMIITDPPYNLPAREIGQVAAREHGNFHEAAGEMSQSEFTDFLERLFKQLCKHSFDGSIHYIFMDWRHIHELINAANPHYSELKNLCIWNKDRAGMGSFYRSQHELVFVYKKGQAPHQNNFELGQHGRYRSNVWQYPSVRNFSDANGEATDNNALSLHPTMKPVGLIRDAILDCSKRDEIILDAFIGSGTTLLAAEQAHRICFGIEISPRYLDVAIRRWQSLTGKDAIHRNSNHSFNDIYHEVNHGKG